MDPISPGNQKPGLVFVFDGRTRLWDGMGAYLYKSEPVFKEVIDRCNHIFGEFNNGSIIDTLANSGVPAPYGDASKEILHTTSLAAYQLALFDFWRSRGIQPDAVTGLCVGEWLCLYAAGTLTLEETMRVICSGMQMITRKSSPSAIMLLKADYPKIVSISQELGGSLCVCGKASPSTTLAVCPEDDLHTVAARLQIEGIVYHATKLAWPYHTPLMSHDKSVMLGPTKGIEANPSKLDLYSSSLGRKLPAGSIFHLDHWHSIPRAEVSFEQAIRNALDDGFQNFLVFGAFDYLDNLLNETAVLANRKIHLVNAVSQNHHESDWIQIVSRELNKRGHFEKTEPTPHLTSINSSVSLLKEVTKTTFPSTLEYSTAPYNYADPYPFYDWLLQKGGAVFSPGENTWLIARYEEVTAALKNPRLSKQTGNPNPSPIDFSMLFRDEPDHSRLRGTLAPAFTPGVVATMESSILAIVEDLMGRIQFGQEVDLISQFAMPLPVRVISEILSVPSKDRAQLGEWSAATVPPSGEDGSPLAEAQQALGSAIMGLKTYFAEHFRAGAAAGCPHLAKTAPAFQEGPALSGDELVGSSVLLMIAGHETTVNLIGNGLLCLLRNPEQMEKLRGNPDLIDSAVEEMLRFESPVARGTFRVTTEDVVIGGTVIPQGSFVAPLIGAANRDPRVFPNPNAFNIERRGNKHLAFGNGSHYCLGAQLARLEARVVFKYLLKRFTDIEFADPIAIGNLARLDWIGSTAVRGLRSLPVVLKE